MLYASIVLIGEFFEKEKECLGKGEMLIWTVIKNLLAYMMN